MVKFQNKMFFRKCFVILFIVASSCTSPPRSIEESSSSRDRYENLFPYLTFEQSEMYNYDSISSKKLSCFNYDTISLDVYCHTQVSKLYDFKNVRFLQFDVFDSCTESICLDSFPQLQVLIINGSGLSFTFSGTKNIKYFKWCCAGLQKMPLFLLKFPNLKGLSLIDNKIEILDIDICCLPNLSNVYLGANAIKRNSNLELQLQKIRLCNPAVKIRLTLDLDYI